MRLDFVCPVHAPDIDRLVFMLETWRARCHVSGCLRVYAPAVELPLFEQRLAALSSSRLILCSQESVVGASTAPGWYRQMMVKLGAARDVESDIYGAIDADCFFAADFDGSLLADGVCGPRKPTTVSDWWSWYPDVAELLGVPLTEFISCGEQRPPFFFEREVVLEALTRLGALWADRLSATSRWTELAIYDVMAAYVGRRPRGVPHFTHDVIPTPWRRTDRQLTEEVFARWSPEETFSGQYAFGVLHSTHGLPIERLRGRLRGFFG